MLQFLTCEIAKGLKFLTENEMEVATAATTHLVGIESPSPVNAEQSEHWQVNAHTYAGRAFKVKRVKVFKLAPAVTGFKESECPYICRLVQENRVTELYGQFRIQVTVISVISISVTLTYRGKRRAVVTTE